MKAMPEKLLRLLAVTLAFILFANCANAIITVKPGDRIQAAIDAANPGETITVQSGTYQESLVADEPVILKGIDSGNGIPRVESENGPAITLKANGIVLEGFWAKSASGWTGDAGILVLSNDNIIRNNMASGNGNVGILLQQCINNTVSDNVAQGNGNEGISLKNCSRNLLEGNQVKDNKYGLKLADSEGNRIIGNTFNDNRFEAIYLQESQGNLIEGNYAGNNDGGLVMDNSRDNLVRKNDFVGNEKGISLSYLQTGNEVQSKGSGVVISYNSMPTQESVSSNNTIYLNNLSNKKNAYDDSLDNWDNGMVGNNYSDFNDPAEGCSGKKICDSTHPISGGPSTDEYPQASPVKIPGRSTGQGGAYLQLFGTSFLPGSKMNLNFTTPASIEVWVVRATGISGNGNLQDDLYLGRNTSGDVVLTAPVEVGSYRLLMHDINGTSIISQTFRVAVPGITASPTTVNTCEKISVAFWGASGQKDDWIGMYKTGSSNAISRQVLEGKESGNLTFSGSDAGSYMFQMFRAGASEPLASSNAVEVKANSGHKVIAEPSHVAPGGTVTVTYWGAPPEGTGIIGMYGMTRPDKFDMGKRHIGTQSCGSIVWRLPATPGQYDFRMFQKDITDFNQGAYQLLGQSNVVTVS